MPLPSPPVPGGGGETPGAERCSHCLAKSSWGPLSVGGPHTYELSKCVPLYTTELWERSVTQPQQAITPIQTRKESLTDKKADAREAKAGPEKLSTTGRGRLMAFSEERLPRLCSVPANGDAGQKPQFHT